MRLARPVAGRQFGRPLAVAAQELAVAAPKNFLIAADDVGARQIAVGVQTPPLRQQGLGVDDDLALAAEIGGQGGVDHALEARALGLVA
ncbi:hypothetical protein D3C87_2014120 [compost metagenome]